MANPVVHFEIMGKDAAKLRKFYTEAFGWKIGAPVPGSPAEYSLVEKADAGEAGSIGGGIGEVTDGYGGHVTFYVYVDDVGKTLDKLERLGATKMMGPDQVPGGPVIGLFKDPEGHVIGLVHDASQNRN
jgi:predicted enzyme related to lactoylglutathione lyase